MGAREQRRIPRAGLRAVARSAAVAAFVTSAISWRWASWLDQAMPSPARVSAAARSSLHTALSIAVFAALTALVTWWSTLARRRHDAPRSGVDAPHEGGQDARPAAERGDHVAPTAGCARDDAALLVEHHRHLDEAIALQLRRVVSDTEASALTMITQLRSLSEGATGLLGYLGNSDRSANALESKIEGSVASIVEIGAFVQGLPRTIREDVEAIHAAAVTELNGLAGFTAIIKDISDQTKLLAVNTAILAATSRGDTVGLGVVAREMRELSDRSAEAATMIEEGLQHAQRIMRDGLSMRSMEQRVQEGAATVESLRKLQTSYEEVQVYYRLMFKVVMEHNTALAHEIADMLGQFQGQDVMRQRLERVAAGLARRNDALRELPEKFAGADIDLSALPPRMLDVVNEFVDIEAHHADASPAAGASADAPKFELF